MPISISKLKKTIKKVNFSPPAEKEIFNILDQVRAQGKFTEDSIEKILAIIDFEIVAGEIEADLLEDIALEFKNYATGIENEIESLLSKVNSNLEEDLTP